jgi:glucosyl-3-phosphoglycerate synthase
VRPARRQLIDRGPLVDEMLVIAPAPEDETMHIAETEGARVVAHPDILPRYGSYRGKGEALWKSLYETSGDIVAWCDTDIRDWHPRFVYGTLGPLLAEPRIGYVKGYYRRPIVVDGVLKEGGGGRVTELVARPLINLFFPELSGMIQPLSGEYAGRRELLESVPFFTGYAVETGLLIDILEAEGLSALGQVDLERRIHRNQTLPSLSQMSFVILQAAIRKLEERHRIELLTEVGHGMKLIHQEGDSFSLVVREIGDQMRPAMKSVPAYQEKRRALKADR